MSPVATGIFYAQPVTLDSDSDSDDDDEDDTNDAATVIFKSPYSSPAPGKDDNYLKII